MSEIEDHPEPYEVAFPGNLRSVESQSQPAQSQVLPSECCLDS
jgi:hypothetical protein